MLDYVMALAEDKNVQTQGSTLNAHVIITNNLSKSKMTAIPEFMDCRHRLGQKLPNMKFVFMFESFVTTLYDRFKDDEAHYQKRWGYLSQRLAWQMQQDDENKNVILDEAKANELADWAHKQPAIDVPVNLQDLKTGLDEIMSGK